MTQLTESSQILLRTHIVLLVVVSIIVAGRFLARFKKRAQLSWDDAWAVGAWISFTSYSALIIFEIPRGYYQLLDTPILPADYILKEKIEYAGALVFESANLASKISLLCLYRRIFITPTFRKWSAAVFVFCLAWYMSSILATALKCVPVYKSWNTEVPGTCINLIGFLAGYEIGNIICDMMILCLPVRMVHLLYLSRPKKISLNCVFLLGGFVCITSILRISYTYGKDPRVTLYSVPLWSDISVASSVICANLPVLGPLLPLTITVRSLYEMPIRPFKRSSKSRRWGPSTTNFVPEFSGAHHVEVTGGSYASLASNHKERQLSTRDPPGRIGKGMDHHAADEYPLDSIRVHQTFDLV
ncbi:hypothetical protein F5Y16DRAFT_76735 [Xylariaceae sp. FL0255]|nr:hypothetical protein F5Y16DRAFT_76735 [Xylariaceae sp. FL0255]